MFLDKPIKGNGVEYPPSYVDPESVLESLSEGILLISPEGCVVYANRSAQGFLKSSYAETLLEEIISRGECVRGEEPLCQFRFSMTCSKRYLQIQLSRWPQQGSGVEMLLCHLRDVTVERHRENWVRRQLNRFQQYLDVASVILVAVDTEGRIGLVNLKGCELLGCREEDVLAKQWFDIFVPQEYRHLAKRRFFHVLARLGKLAGYTEMPIVTLKGQRRWIAWHHTFLRNGQGEVIGILGSGQDVTERRNAEAALKQSQEALYAERIRLKRLASKLTLVEECERRHMASVLHDDIGQRLYLAGLKLQQLQTRFKDPQDVQGFTDLKNIIQETLVKTRSLTFDLSYPILYELGFEKAVAGWLQREIEDKYAIETELIDDGQEKPLDEDVKILLFRDLRELLFNTIKHATATHVRVLIKRVEQTIHVSVEDNGCGFDPEQCLSIHNHYDGFGLFSIRQRLEDLGGQMRVDSAPQQGCRITIIAPLRNQV